MKAPFVVAPVIAASVLFAAVAVATGEGETQTAQVVTRHLHARTTTYFELDNGKKGHSAGDLFTFTHVLMERAKRVGRTEGYCVRILQRASHCTMTTFLGGGQIEASGPLEEGSGSRLAVTGGTGVFEHANGSVTVRRAGFFQLDLTYKLTVG